MTSPLFSELGLAEPLMRALEETGYTTPTPIQTQAIPPLLKGRDLLGLAETGSGKTAAFALPLLHRLAEDGARAAPRCTRALILAPTRELAIQIGESIGTYGRHMGLRHTVIFGGVGQRPQVKAVERGIDIVVATPGRLLDLVDQRCLRLEQVSCLILDEADRMFDMGFIRDVRKIVRLVPKQRQTLLFSATMPHDIAALAAEVLHNPERVEIARAGKAVDRIDQRVHFVAASQKRDLLNTLLADPALARVIIFTRTKRGADRVSRNLEQANVKAFAIHGNKSQGARQHALESFKKGGTRVLVATDIAARGIDIDDITHVINYELPNIPESYVHRIGRTARAGAEGIAIAFCAPDERPFLRDIERLTRQPLKVEPAPANASGLGPRHDRELPDVPASTEPDPDARFVPREGGRTPHQAKRERQTGATTTPEQRGFRKHGDRRSPDASRAPRPEARPSAEGAVSDFKPWENRESREGGERSDRPRSAGAGDRGLRRDDARGERPRGDRAPGARPEGGRSFGARPAGARSDGPRGDRPTGDRAGFRGGDRGPRTPREGGDRPSGDRAPRDHSAGPRPGGDRPDRGPPRAPREGGDRPFQSRGFKSQGRDASRPEDQRSRGFRDGPPAGGRAPDRGGDRGRPTGDRTPGDRPRFAGPRPEGDRRDGPRNSAPRGDAPRHAGPHAGPKRDDARAERPRTDGDRRPREGARDQRPEQRSGAKPAWAGREAGTRGPRAGASDGRAPRARPSGEGRPTDSGDRSLK